MNINTTKKTKEVLLDAGKETSLKVNVEKTLHMFMFHHQNAGQNSDIKIANKFFENMAKFKEMTVTDKNYIHEK